MRSTHFGKNLRCLTPRRLESRLRDTAVIYTKSKEGWSKPVRKAGVFFDLSQLEWVEFGALAQLVLLIEAALRSEIRVTVALPFCNQLHSETQQQLGGTKAEERVVRRRRAAGFLKYLRFEEALRPDHLAPFARNLTVLREHDPTTGIPTDQVTEDGDEPPRVSDEIPYRWHFPLTWLSRDDTVQVENIARFFTHVLAQRHRGLEPIDADAIANVVLHELLQNVTEHAGRSHALVAAWARPEDCPPDGRDYLDLEQPYIDWLSQATTPCVELVFGDSGDGIPHTLVGNYKQAKREGKSVPSCASSEIANVLVWAFDRWSTCKEDTILRGTRGLYRLDRIVCQYQGVVTIRAEDDIAGWDHGGPSYDRPISNQNPLSRLPGTVVRLRMPALHERLPTRDLPDRTPAGLSFTSVPLGAITSDGISEQQWKGLQDRLSPSSQDRPTWIVAAVNPQEAEHCADAVKEVLRQTAELRHPGALILAGLPGGWHLITNSIETINDEVAATHRDSECFTEDHYEIWDPVLVIGDHGETAWAGTAGSHLIVLSALLQTPDGVLTAQQIEHFIPDPDQRTATLRKLRSDPSVVTIGDDRSLVLRLTPTGLFSAVGKLLRNHIDSVQDGVLSGPSGRVFRTPALILVSKWLYVNVILEKTCGYGLAAAAISHALAAHPCWHEVGPADVLLSDATATAPLLQRLKAQLKIATLETLHTEAGDCSGGILRTNDRVLIHTDILLSAESAKRLVEQILRDHALPIAATCVVDARPEPGDLDAWGITIPVVSLARLDLAARESTNQRDVVNISPVTREIETDEQVSDSDLYSIPTAELGTLITKDEALHFTHIGRPIGRHFTFYLDATELLNEAPIRQAFESTIEQWLENNSAISDEQSQRASIDVWHPSPEPKRSAPARRLAEWIRDNCQ